MARTHTIYFNVLPNNPGPGFTAYVLPVSLGPFPMGTKSVTASGDTREMAAESLKKDVRKMLRGDRITFSGA